MHRTQRVQRKVRFIWEDAIIYLFIYRPIQSMSANDWTQALDFQISKPCDDRSHSSAKIPIYFIAIWPT